ncbi:MAG: tetratricopeptide repeat protein [Candidatus Acidiferrales bacterium]|jgi:tetratricopeptide (TPR) repeat protein
MGPQASPASLLGRGLLALLLAALLVQAAREAVASRLAARNSLDGIRRAERWDPSNPEYPARFGRALAADPADADPREVAHAFETAARLGPHRAENWAGLGEALDLAGDSAGAARAYERALELFPRSPAINWQFANFLIRAGDATQAAAPLRAAIEGDATLRMGAFDLEWRAGMPPEEILAIVPARQEILSAYLDYLVRTERLDAAADAWRRLIASPDAFDMDAALRYFDALLHAHRVDALEALWADLARHDPARVHAADGANRITNGGFEDAVLGGGFDWRIVPIDGAEAEIDTETVHGGSRSLCVRFDGKHNLAFGHVAQYAAVEPDTAYRLTAWVRTEGITTDSGPRIGVYDPLDRAALSAETGNLTGTAAWQEQTLEFRTPPETRIVIVQVVRPPSRKLDNQIAGTLWLDDVSLSPIP